MSDDVFATKYLFNQILAANLSKFITPYDENFIIYDMCVFQMLVNINADYNIAHPP